MHNVHSVLYQSMFSLFPLMYVLHRADWINPLIPGCECTSCPALPNIWQNTAALASAVALPACPHNDSVKMNARVEDWQNDTERGTGRMILIGELAEWYWVGNWQNDTERGTGRMILRGELAEWYWVGNWQNYTERGIGRIILRGELAELCWEGKLKQRKKTLPLCQPQISDRLTHTWTRSSMVRGRWKPSVMAWAVQPVIHLCPNICGALQPDKKWKIKEINSS
jgi:hypothetical protein